MTYWMASYAALFVFYLGDDLLRRHWLSSHVHIIIFLCFIPSILYTSTPNDIYPIFVASYCQE